MKRKRLFFSILWENLKPDSEGAMMREWNSWSTKRKVAVACYFFIVGGESFSFYLAGVPFPYNLVMSLGWIAIWYLPLEIYGKIKRIRKKKR